MKLLCRLGFHRWSFRDVRGAGCVDTLARCRRLGCTRYPKWKIVNCTPRAAARSTHTEETRRA